MTEISVEAAREAIQEEADRIGLRNLARQMPLPVSTLQSFLAGTVPTGERREVILAYAEVLKERKRSKASESVPRENKTPASEAGGYHLSSAGLAALWSVQSMQVHLGTMLSQILQGDVDRWTEHLTSEAAAAVLHEHQLHQAMTAAGVVPQAGHSASESPPDDTGDATQQQRGADARRRRA